MNKFIPLLIICLFIIISPTYGAEYTVSSFTESDYDGSCADADCTLRDAIGAANANDGNDTITLPAGTYTLSLAGAGEDGNGTGDLDFTGVSDTYTINGAGSASTIIDAADIDRVLDIKDTTVTLNLNDLKIYNGTALGANGGGIYNSGILNISDCVINNNISTFGGGIISTGNVTVAYSTISNNSGSGGGGGISVIGGAGDLTVQNSLVYNNSASGGHGGGIYFDGADFVAINSTISTNSASTGSYGGGIFIGNSSTTANFVNCTVVGNTGPVNGSNGVGVDAKSINIKGSILYNNSSSNCYHNTGSINSSGYNIDSGTSCSFSGTGDQNSTNPLLDALADNGGSTQTMAIQVSPSISAAINKIPAAFCTDQNFDPVTADQRGSTRNGYCDVGAYEYQDSTAPVITITNDTAEYNTVECADVYTDQDATAVDAIDGTRTVTTTSNNVDESVPGSYSVNYSASDLSNNEDTASRAVTVEDTADPSITLTGDTAYTVEVGSVFTDPGAAASDTCDGDITANIQATSTVDISTIGSYTVTYNVSDASGNPAVAQVRTVNVVAVDEEEKEAVSVKALKNNKVKITYSDCSTATFSVFSSGKTKPKVSLSTDKERIVALKKNAEKIRILDSLTGDILKTKTLYKKKQTGTKLKVFNYNDDNKDEIVIASKQNNNLKTTALSLTSGNKLKNKNTKTKQNIKAKTLKIKVKNRTISIKHEKKILAQYRITTKAKLKAI